MIQNPTIKINKERNRAQNCKVERDLELTNYSNNANQLH